jgi:hypothetical protein
VVAVTDLAEPWMSSKTSAVDEEPSKERLTWRKRLLLSLIRHIVPTWYRPTSGFSVVSKHLLQVVYSMMWIGFLRQSSSSESKTALWIAACFSPLGRTIEISLGQQWRLLSRVNDIS